METNQVTVVELPTEIQEIAKNVSVEKRNEVQTVLNQVFNGVAKMREQLDSVDVVNESDKVNMKLANTIRIGVRQVRLDAEKTFDAKRGEVQQQMLSFKTEDALWLKAKQTMQILTKEIEENARWKEETKERFEKEQKELKIQQRLLEIQKFAPEIMRSEIENMSDELFQTFISTLELNFNNKIEAEKQAEAERLAKIEAEKAEQERIKAENERLRIEAEEREKQFEIERKQAVEKQIIEREKAESDRKKADELARIEAEKQAKIQADLRAKAESDRKEKERIEAELKVKQDADNARIAKEQAELKAKQEAEKKAKNAPEKEKLEKLVSDIEAIKFPETTSDEAKKIMDNVKGLLSKVTNYINENTKNL